jgi:hypothetical protein
VKQEELNAMKINLPPVSKAVSLSFLIAVFSLSVIAQVNVAKKPDKVPPPAEETFSATDAVAAVAEILVAEAAGPRFVSEKSHNSILSFALVSPALIADAYLYL